MRAPRRNRPIEVDLDELPAGAPPAPEVEAAEVVPAVEAAGDDADEAQPKEKKPLYPRLLRLRHIRPNAWQRAALGEGAIGVGVLLAMADLASAWTIVALPVAVAGVVKAHDALQGLLDGGTRPDEDQPAPDDRRL